MSEADMRGRLTKVLRSLHAIAVENPRHQLFRGLDRGEVAARLAPEAGDGRHGRPLH